MPKITIFTTNACAYCGMVKKWLAAKGYKYEEVNIEEHPDRGQEAFELSGALTVPITLVTKTDKTREIIVGFNLAKLAPAIA